MKPTLHEQPAYVGVDLAWGERARTGLALSTAEGALLSSCCVRSDEEIAAFVEWHAPGAVLAAIDAPLIVTNMTGRRACEAEVQSEFGRYGAGPYPSNLGNPAFAQGTRGARLCRRLGLDMDPASTSAKRAIEVYPHPAMVVLLDLDYVIPYKAKQGRTLPDLKRAFDTLMTAMQERLVDLRLGDSPRWAELRAVAEAAERKVELDRIEDEIDAIFCAHLAHRWHREGLGASRVFGDFGSGYIVVPTPEVPLRPPRSPRPARPTAGPDLQPALLDAIASAAPSLTTTEVVTVARAVQEVINRRPVPQRAKGASSSRFPVAAPSAPPPPQAVADAIGSLLDTV